jgi:hypothetical protein
MKPRMVGSYLVRVSVEAGRWRLEVRDVRDGRAWTFDTFEALAAQLERLARAGAP